MTSMEDLMATISSSMHVSQDGYDLKALHAHLAQTLFVPSLSLSPSQSYRPMTSRSSSSTRKPYVPLGQPPSSQALPSQDVAPIDEVTVSVFEAHPSPSTNGFESDAFAPLWRNPHEESDPWGFTKRSSPTFASTPTQQQLYHPPAEDEEMTDEDVVSEAMDEDGEQYEVENDCGMEEREKDSPRQGWNPSYNYHYDQQEDEEYQVNSYGWDQNRWTG
ncbi:hypothetical protein P7C73_g2698, partial [Tremellales sp. Uapishka_1]